MSCCVQGCESNPRLHSDVSFFKFPGSYLARKRWLDALPTQSHPKSYTSKICSRHFEARYLVNNNRRRRLLKNAVPSIDIQTDPCMDHENEHSSNTTTPPRSELAEISRERDHLANQLTDAMSAIRAKEAECESLRSEVAAYSSLNTSLQKKLKAAEKRERLVHKCNSTISTLKKDNKCLEERNQALSRQIHRLASEVAAKEAHKEQAIDHHNELLGKLSSCLRIDVCDASHPSEDSVLARVGELVAELQELKAKITATCGNSCPYKGELTDLKSAYKIERQGMTATIAALQSQKFKLNEKCLQYEKDLQFTKDRLKESEVKVEMFRQKLREVESSCHQLCREILNFNSTH